MTIDWFKEKGHKGCPQQHDRHTQSVFPSVGEQIKGDKKEQGKAYAVEHIYSPDIHIGITRGEEVKYIGT